MGKSAKKVGDAVAIAVPPKGRTCIRTLAEFESKGFIEHDEFKRLAKYIMDDRKRLDVERQEIERGERKGYSTREELIKELNELRKEDDIAFCLSVYPNLHRRGKPERIVLACYEIEIQGIPVKLVGTDHYYAADHITSGATELAFIGFDEIAASFAKQNEKKRIKRWPGFNNSSVKGTEPVVLGSAGLDDYCAHFIASKRPELFDKIGFNEEYFIYYGIKSILADQKYIPFYAHFINTRKSKQTQENPSDFLRSESIEDDIERYDEENDTKYPALGVIMANTGARAKEKGLWVYGLPVLQSETLIVADQIAIEENDDVQTIARNLVCNTYVDEKRIEEYAKWYLGLCGNFGYKWAYRPSLEDMYVDAFDNMTWNKKDSVVKPGIIGMLKSAEAELKR